MNPPKTGGPYSLPVFICGNYAAARKIAGGPRAFGLWVHGDGNGGVQCIRIRDETGQTHQVRGEAITWKGWRYLTFPLQPAPDDGRTMIPLPDAGAEQRVTWGHWGGANDGEVHQPIGWDCRLCDRMK